jgi:hypothetical protein
MSKKAQIGMDPDIPPFPFMAMIIPVHLHFVLRLINFSLSGSDKLINNPVSSMLPHRWHFDLAGTTSLAPSTTPPTTTGPLMKWPSSL